MRGGVKEPWTASDVDLFQIMYEAGKSVDEMAVVLGRTAPAISARIAAFERRRRTWDRQC
jgi:hypothetical protein